MTSIRTERFWNEKAAQAFLAFLLRNHTQGEIIPESVEGIPTQIQSWLVCWTESSL